LKKAQTAATVTMRSAMFEFQNDASVPVSQTAKDRAA
jgi:hypothetical protein